MADKQPRILRRSLGHGDALASRARRRAARLRALNRPDVLAPIEVMKGAGGAVTCAVPALEGVDLATLSARRAPLSAGEVMWLGARVARALAALHGAGLAHTDLSPGNVLIRSHGVVLLDTLAGARADERGTPGFRGPEVVAGEPCEASDVYSLGCLLRWAAADDACARVSSLTSSLVAPNPAARPTAEDVPELLQELGTSVSIDLPRRADVVAALRSQAAVRTERTVAGRPWRWTRWAVRGGVAVGALGAAAGIAMPLAHSANVAAPVALSEGTVHSGVEAGLRGGDLRAEASDGAVGAVSAEAAGVVSDAEAAAEGLTHARFQALAGGDGGALRATVTGEATTAREARLLADDLDAGAVVYRGLVGTVTGAVVTSVAPSQATVAVEYALSDHTVVRDGAQTHVDAVTEEATLTLVLGDDNRWRVASATPVP